MKQSEPIIGLTTDLDSDYIRLKHHYCEAIIDAGGIPVLIPPKGDAAKYVKKIDGLLIPGGDDLDPFYYREDLCSQGTLVSRQRSDFEFALLKEVLNAEKPVIGICYGMQLINVFFGGTLYQDIEDQGLVAITHKNSYHLIMISENKFLKSGMFTVNSTHHQAVKMLGKGLSACAYSEDRLVEAFCRGDYPFLIGVQWHPERLPGNELTLKLFRSFIEACDN